MYAKWMAPECWPYAEVKGHWDQLLLRCWVQKEGQRTSIRSSPPGLHSRPEELLQKCPIGQDKGEGNGPLSGTIATQGGLVYGDSYELEMEDPVLKRKIKSQYRVKNPPQYL
jgi:hypothetical protein